MTTAETRDRGACVAENMKASDIEVLHKIEVLHERLLLQLEIALTQMEAVGQLPAEMEPIRETMHTIFSERCKLAELCKVKLTASTEVFHAR